jgi:hypothetical protein
MVELTAAELERVAGGQCVSCMNPPPTGGGSVSGDFAKLFADLRSGASLNVIQHDYRAILHDAGVGGFSHPPDLT